MQAQSGVAVLKSERRSNFDIRIETIHFGLELNKICKKGITNSVSLSRSKVPVVALVRRE